MKTPRSAATTIFDDLGLLQSVQAVPRLGLNPSRCEPFLLLLLLPTLVGTPQCMSRGAGPVSTVPPWQGDGWVGRP